MAIEKITETELDQIGLQSVGDTPEKPKEALEAVERELLVPKINEIIDKLDEIVPTAGPGDMQKNTYDTDKNGVVDYSENGFGTYTYAKDGTQHILTNQIGYENIRFVPTEDFNDGDTFKVNGEAVTAKTQDGEPLSGGYFKAGNVVTAFLNGDTLNFKSGGAGLNFAVVGGTTQPASPKENTIWVNTDTAIGGWAFSAAEPTAAEGLVWILTGTTSPAAFNAAKKETLTVYPQVAKQYIGGKWEPKEVQAYVGGEWKLPGMVLISDGVYTGLSTWTKQGPSTEAIDKLTVTENTTYNGVDHVVLLEVTNTTADFVSTAIDMTPFSTLEMELLTKSASQAYQATPYVAYRYGVIAESSELGIPTARNIITNAGNYVVSSTGGYAALSTLKFDVSALEGYYKVCITNQASGGGIKNNIAIKNMRLV